MSATLEAGKALKLMQQVSPGAIIAGGFLRDQFYCVPPKDIDFFVPFGTTVDVLRKVFPEARLEDYSKWLSYGNLEVKSVINLGTIGGLPAQVIELAEGLDPMGRVQLHDFGFCQIATRDIYSDVTTTDAFNDDAAKGTVTLVHCEDAKQFARSMKRWDRLSGKYPNKRLVIPKEFEQWIHPLSEHWTSQSPSSSAATS